LKVSRRTLQDYRNNGILSYIQVGGKILYRTSDVQRTIMSGFKEAYRLRDVDNCQKRIEVVSYIKTQPLTMWAGKESNLLCGSIDFGLCQFQYIYLV